MYRQLGIVIALSAAVLTVETSAQAQMWYPGGYGGYGMSQWGADPASGFMAGLGSYARGRGVYELEKAKADAINVETMVKWNKALRAKQIQMEKDRQIAEARKEAEQEARLAQQYAEDGTTLNRLLLEILDSDPAVVKASRVVTPLSPAAIREIPFEWNSEAITLCLDQMTGQDSLPPTLMDSRYDAERTALHEAVAPALAEDLKGTISPETLARVKDAVAKFKAAFTKKSSEFDAGRQDALDYLTTLDSLSRLLQDPSLKAFLAQLEDGKERTVGDLIAFMNAFNLRFGPATSERQVEIYARLIPAMTQARDAAVASRPATPDAAGNNDLRAAATAAFKGMPWSDLDAHDRGR